MHKFLDPLKPYYSAGCARLHLGETGVTYNRSAIELDAFSRPLWALVPFWVGGGSDPQFEEIYRKGLAAGADPENPEYWGTTGEYDQCYVEMAAIACGILTAPEKLWTPLSDTEKQNLAAWLGQINVHTIPDCNWQFFRILGGMAWMQLWIFLWSLIPIVGIVFGIIRMYEYRFVPYILMTRDDVKPADAIKISKQETMGYKGKMFGADILLGAVY